MNWFKKSVSLAYFPRKTMSLKDKWVRLRGIADTIGLSARAREKLEWIIFYNTVGRHNAKGTAKYFGLSRKTLHKWLKRFDERNLKTLEEVSRAPVTTRSWTVTPEEEDRVTKIRNFSKCKWGKEKIKKRYLIVYGKDISTSKIQKIINKLNLYPDTKEHILRLKRKRLRKNRLLITNFEKKPFLGYLWHTDTVIIWWYGVRKVIFTAMEETTKIAFARVYKSSSSLMAKDFLQRLTYLSQGELQNIHHDNGSEFEKHFEEACRDLGINQVYSRVRTPKDNPALERFNYTIQDEWLSVSDVGLDDINEANIDLTNWLLIYNNVRPHESLYYMTPLGYATERFKVSPMWASSTHHLQKQILDI